MSSNAVLLALSLLTCAQLASGSAWAQTRPALSWVREPGAEACIAAPQLGRLVERIIGPVLVGAPDGTVSIEGRIARARSGGFEADIRVSNAQGRLIGSRRLQAVERDCRQLDEQLAFVIAVTLDPDRALAEVPGDFAGDTDPGPELLAQVQAAPPAAAPGPSTTASDAPKPTRPQRSQRSQSRVRFSAALGPVAGVPALDGANAGAQAEVGLLTGTWSHHLHAVWWLYEEDYLEYPESFEVSAPAEMFVGESIEESAFGTIAAIRASGDDVVYFVSDSHIGRIELPSGSAP